jgi:hypothetical protein
MTEPKERPCPDCLGEGFFYDDGEYDPRDGRCHGGRKIACRRCGGTGIIGLKEADNG